MNTRTVATPEIPKSHDYIVVPKTDPKTDSTLVEKYISLVLNQRFSGGIDGSGNAISYLRITQRVYKMEDVGDGVSRRVDGDPNVQWVIGSGNPDYMFGFRVITDGKRITFRGSINTWSHWAMDYMRNALAEHLGAKIHGNDDKPVKVDASAIYELKEWLKVVMPKEKLDDFYRDYMEHTPGDFANVAGFRRNL